MVLVILVMILKLILILILCMSEYLSNKYITLQTLAVLLLKVIECTLHVSNYYYYPRLLSGGSSSITILKS
jgi:hypothetical protein